MVKSKKIVLLLVGLLAIIITGVLVHVLSTGHGGDDGKLLLYGNVDIREVQLAFDGTGRIQQLAVEEGASITAGQFVAGLDPSRYEDSVSNAQARVRAQSHVLARLLAGSRPAEIRAASARLRGAEATFTNATQALERARTLAKDDYVSQQHLDSAKAAVSIARATHDALQAELALLKEGPRQEDIEAARAQLDALAGEARLAERKLGDTRLYAPTNGVLRNRILEVGDMAFPSRPVVTLALDNPVWVRAYVSEPDLGKVTNGMPAHVYTDSFPGKAYAGWVGYISPTAEFTPKQVQTTDLRTRLVYQVRVYVQNPSHELRLGMPVTVKIDRAQ